MKEKMDNMKEKSSTLITRVVIFFIIYFMLFAILRDLTNGSIFAVAIAFLSSKPLAKELNKNSSSNDKKE